MRFGVSALVAALAVAAPALAQTSSQPGLADPADNPAKRFERYATSDGYKKSIGQIAVMGATISQPDCKDHKAVKRAAITIYVGPTFGEGMHPVNGLWMDRILMDSCGKPGHQNILVQANPGGTPRAALKMPGLTNANPPMQDLVIKDVMEALKAKKCSDAAQVFPLDSVVGKEAKPRKIDAKGMLVEGSWKETWSFRACGKTVSATVDFAADGKGGLTHKIKM